MEDSLSSEALTALLHPYGTGPVITAQRLPLGEDNENVHVTTADAEWVVRRYLISDRAKAAGELALVRFLADAGYPTPAPAESGQGPIVMSQGRPVAVFPFVPGRVPGAVKPGLARQFGELLARLHLLAADYPGADLPVLDRPRVLRSALAADRSGDPAAGRWHAALSGMLAWCEENRAALAGVPHGPLHHDLHRENVLVDRDDTIRAVLDFDEINVGPLILDLCRAVHYLAHEDPGLVADDGLVRALVEGYESVRPLSDTERALLGGLFQLGNLYDAAVFLIDCTDVPIAECKSYLIHRRNPDPFASVAGPR